MKKFTLPEYTKSMPDDANLNRKDLVEIFGYSKPCAINYGIKNGLIPEPDGVYGRVGKRPQQYWSLGLLRSLESKALN